jgi:hypothetical protein
MRLSDTGSRHQPRPSAHRCSGLHTADGAAPPHRVLLISPQAPFSAHRCRRCGVRGRAADGRRAAHSMSRRRPSFERDVHRDDRGPACTANARTCSGTADSPGEHTTRQPHNQSRPSHKTDTHALVIATQRPRRRGVLAGRAGSQRPEEKIASTQPLQRRRGSFTASPTPLELAGEPLHAPARWMPRPEEGAPGLPDAPSSVFLPGSEKGRTLCPVTNRGEPSVPMSGPPA